MDLVLDVGNTFLKAGFFENHQLVELHERINEEDLLALLAVQSVKNCMICSVRGDSLFWQTQLNLLIPNLFFLDHHTPLPIQNHYKTPQTLGMDRVAALVGARVLHQEGACLVIDAGTCITYDFLSANDDFWGGGISLGLQMRFQALHTFTQKLPLVEWKPQTEKIELIGRQTSEAILSGVVNGYLAEIQGIIEMYKQQQGSFSLCLCGGDAAYIYQHITNANKYYYQQLTLVGLAHILSYQLS